MPDRVNDSALMGSLAVMSVLIISFFNDTNGTWGVTTPRWVGLLSNVCYSIGWYLEFAAIVVILISFTNTHLYGVQLQVSIPLLFTIVGLVLYIVQQLFSSYTLYYQSTADNALDTAPLPPEDLRLSFFLCENIPLYICVIFIFVYTPLSCLSGRRKVKSKIKLDELPRKRSKTPASRRDMRK